MFYPRGIFKYLCRVVVVTQDEKTLHNWPLAAREHVLIGRQAFQ